MNTLNKKKSFVDLEDWRNQFGRENSEEMRRGMISAIQNKDNFEDIGMWEDSLFPAVTISNTILCDMYIHSNKITDHYTIRFGIMQVLGKIRVHDYKVGMGSQLPVHIRKDVYYKVVVLLEHYRDVCGDNFEPDKKMLQVLEDFFWELLINFDPRETPYDEVDRIIKVLFDYGFSEMFIRECCWLGEQEVINEILRRIDTLGPTRLLQDIEWDNPLAQELAVHLTVKTGKLDDIAQKMQAVAMSAAITA